MARQSKDLVRITANPEPRRSGATPAVSSIADARAPGSGEAAAVSSSSRKAAGTRPANDGGPKARHSVRESNGIPIACACTRPADVGPGSRALAVDSDAKLRNLSRLRRIEGQVRGLHKMVEDDRYCADILGQLSAVHEALRAVGRELMRNHLKHCAAGAIKAGNDRAEAMYDELVELMYKNAR